MFKVIDKQDGEFTHCTLAQANQHIRQILAKTRRMGGLRIVINNNITTYTRNGHRNSPIYTFKLIK